MLVLERVFQNLNDQISAGYLHQFYDKLRRKIDAQIYLLMGWLTSPFHIAL